jgi:adenine-specific DNA glycosylase
MNEYRCTRNVIGYRALHHWRKVGYYIKAFSVQQAIEQMGEWFDDVDPPHVELWRKSVYHE